MINTTPQDLSYDYVKKQIIAGTGDYHHPQLEYLISAIIGRRLQIYDKPPHNPRRVEKYEWKFGDDKFIVQFQRTE